MIGPFGKEPLVSFARTSLRASRVPHFDATHEPTTSPKLPSLEQLGEFAVRVQTTGLPAWSSRMWQLLYFLPLPQ